MTMRIMRIIILLGSDLMPLTPKEIVKILEQNGFTYVSSNGSHRKYQNKSNGKICIVPFHSKDLKKGTEQNILKQAGLK